MEKKKVNPGKLQKNGTEVEKKKRGWEEEYLKNKSIQYRIRNI
jgi:hypothetical protein